MNKKSPPLKKHEPVLLDESYLDEGVSQKGSMPYLFIAILVFTIIFAFWSRYASVRQIREVAEIEQTQEQDSGTKTNPQPTILIIENE